MGEQEGELGRNQIAQARRNRSNRRIQVRNRYTSAAVEKPLEDRCYRLLIQPLPAVFITRILSPLAAWSN